MTSPTTASLAPAEQQPTNRKGAQAHMAHRIMQRRSSLAHPQLFDLFSLVGFEAGWGARRGASACSTGTCAGEFIGAIVAVLLKVALPEAGDHFAVLALEGRAVVFVASIEAIEVAIALVFLGNGFTVAALKAYDAAIHFIGLIR